MVCFQGLLTHIVVHEEANLLVLFLGEAGSVKVGSQETLLLGGPPSKANAVVHLEFGQLDSNLEDGHAARAIVVDTGALGNAVTVATKHDTVVWISLVRLCQDIDRLDLFDLGVDVGN